MTHTLSLSLVSYFSVQNLALISLLLHHGLVIDQIVNMSGCSSAFIQLYEFLMHSKSAEKKTAVKIQLDE